MKETGYRSVTVPLVVKDVARLREYAACAARYANEALGKKFLEGKEAWNEKTRIESRELKKKDGKTQIFVNLKVASLHPYVDYNKDLSSKVRDAMTTEVDAVWGKYAKQVLAGHRSLPTFNSDRALCVREQHGAGVSVRRAGEGFAVAFNFLPGGNESEEVYPVYKLHEKKVMWLTGLLRGMADGTVPVKKAALILDRHKPKKIMARITYTKTFDPESRGSEVANIGPVGVGGELYIRVAGTNLSLTHYVQALANKKRDCAGLWQRIRLSKRRDAMRKVMKFETWADGPLHQFSRTIVQFCFDNKCNALEWRIAPDQEVDGYTLPWAKLKMRVEYKAQELGIEIREEKELLDKPEKGEVLWARQVNKKLREIGQATRKLPPAAKPTREPIRQVKARLIREAVRANE